jgi:hypothetical protein
MAGGRITLKAEESGGGTRYECLESGEGLRAILLHMMEKEKASGGVASPVTRSVLLRIAKAWLM